MEGERNMESKRRGRQLIDTVAKIMCAIAMAAMLIGLPFIGMEANRRYQPTFSGSGEIVTILPSDGDLIGGLGNG